MPYQVSFKSKSGRGRGLTEKVYHLKPEAQKYADALNENHSGRNARVVVAKKR